MKRSFTDSQLPQNNLMRKKTIVDDLNHYKRHGNELNKIKAIHYIYI